MAALSLAQIGQGLVMQQEAATRISEAMKRTKWKKITGIPNREFEWKTTESPSFWLRDVQRYVQAALPDSSLDLGATMRIALMGAARGRFLRAELGNGTLADFEQLIVARFKNEDAEWRTFKPMRRLALRKDVDGLLQEAENYPIRATVR